MLYQKKSYFNKIFSIQKPKFKLDGLNYLKKRGILEINSYRKMTRDLYYFQLAV